MIIALLVVLAISSERTRELAWLRSWPLRGLSAISFSVFLWHRYPLAVDTKLSALPVSLLLPLTMLLTVLVGAVSYLVLERPFLILARRMSARARELAKA